MSSAQAPVSMQAPVRRPPALAYATIWRWHFYAGLFVLPFILILAVTGSIYLFKPQTDRWEERAYLRLGVRGAVSPDRQLAAVVAAWPNTRFLDYRLPRQPGDAAMVEVGLSDGTHREVFVSPQGKVLGAIDPEKRLSATVARIHGSLLLGRYGDWLVELAASWTILMILTGLYLWWPRPARLAGTLWPRLSLRGRPLLKDLHRVAGFWIAGLMLVMLASGLPWAGAWGSAFTWVRTELGLVRGPQDWKIGANGGHAGHNHDGMAMPMVTAPALPASGLPLSTFVAKAEGEHMTFPVVVLPPHAPQRFGPPTGNVWTAKSEAQNRRLDRQVTYDPLSGAETGRSGFADQHPIDRIVNTGVAWHEGQLFGWVNQLIGLATAATLIAVSVLGAAMWLKRRPAGRFGAPIASAHLDSRAIIVATLALAVALPLFGVSVVVLFIVERTVLSLRGSRAWPSAH